MYYLQSTCIQNSKLNVFFFEIIISHVTERNDGSSLVSDFEISNQFMNLKMTNVKDQYLYLEKNLTKSELQFQIITCQNSFGKSPCACNVLRSVNCSSSDSDSSSVVESSELGEVARLLILTALEDLKYDFFKDYSHFQTFLQTHLHPKMDQSSTTCFEAFTFFFLLFRFLLLVLPHLPPSKIQPFQVFS